MILSDCIGSAFNIKGAMQCPNCRKIEKGQWLYANGYRSIQEFGVDDWTHDEDLYDLGYSEMVNNNLLNFNFYFLVSFFIYDQFSIFAVKMQSFSFYDFYMLTL